MKKPTLAIFIALLVVCGVGGVILKGKSQQEDPAEVAKRKPETIHRGDITVSVIETGTITANKVVEVKGRVTGRLKALYVDEGDYVKQGQLIALVDPKETQLQLEQNEAQLRGAQSAVEKSSIDIAQRRITAQAAYDQAKARVAQLAMDMKAQPTVTRASIEQAQTQLNTAIAEKRRLVDSAHPDQRISMQNAINEAFANYENSEREYKRQADLAQKGYVSGKTSDAAKLEFDLAKTRLELARQNMSHLDSEIQAQILKADEQIAQAKAALHSAQANAYAPESKRQDYLSAVAAMETARAQLQDTASMEKGRQQNLATVDQLRSVVNDAKRQLGETQILAPMSGIVTKKSLQVGELATGLSTFSSGTTIVKIEDKSSMLVKLDINEIDTAKLKLGMTSNIDIDAVPARIYHGTVTKIAPASKESATPGASSSDTVVKYEVEIRLTDPDQFLRSGMSAKCTVKVLNRTDVVVLPVEFLLREGRKAYVFIAPANPKDPKAQATKKEIQLGAQTGASVEVVSGLKDGDQVVRPKYAGPARKGFMQGGPDEN
jgi:HlyD family secretion protein